MPKKLEKELKEKKPNKIVEKKGKVIKTNVTKNEKTTSDVSKKKKEKSKIDNSKKITNFKNEKNKIMIKKNENKKRTIKSGTSDKDSKIAKNEKTKKQEFLNEYYDLPYRYNETVVTILAQTPKRLFVYWDVSDKDKEMYRKAFGDDFFEKTYPVLLVHNEELNYTFEVPINDFANSWYLDIQDSKKNYVVQLGRKFKNVNNTKNVDRKLLKEENINLQNDFVYITDSNKLETPNDHILFELLSDKVKYRNVKNGSEYTIDIKEMVNDLNNVYPAEIVHEIYTRLYSEEIKREEEISRKNPGSGEFVGLPTSGGLRSSGQWN